MARVGVLYSLGFFLVMAVFLAFVIVILNEYDKTSERFIEEAFFEKVHNLDESIQNSFKKIFNTYSGVKLKISDGVFTFTETFPNQNSSTFISELGELKTTVKNNYPIDIYLNEINKTLALTLNPDGTKFFHPVYGGNNITVTFVQGSFNGFTVKITSSATLDSGSCVSSGTSNNPYLDVTTVGSSGSCTETSIQNFELLDTETPRNRLALVNLNGDSLTMQSVLGTNTFDIDVEGLKPSNSTRTVTTTQALEFNFEEFNYRKNGTIRVL